MNDYSALTVLALKAELDSRSLAYKSREPKPNLIALLESDDKLKALAASKLRHPSSQPKRVTLGSKHKPSLAKRR